MSDESEDTSSFCSTCRVRISVCPAGGSRGRSNNQTGCNFSSRVFVLPVPTNQPVATANISLFFSFSSPPLPPASLILPAVLFLLSSSSSSLRAARAKEFRLNFSEVLQGTLSSVSHRSVCVPPPDVTRLNHKLSQLHLAPPLHVSRWVVCVVFTSSHHPG